MLKFWLPIALLFVSGFDALAANSIARVRVEIVPEGIQATYNLSTATTKFDFAKGDIARDGNFEIVTADIQIAGNAVSSTKPFRRFVLRVKSSNEQYDGKYAPLRSIGEGRVLYGYALHADGNAWDTRMTFRLPRGSTSTAGNNKTPNGFVFLGPRSYVKDQSNFTYISPPNLPSQIDDFVMRQFTQSMTAYASKLKQTLPSKPIVIAQTSPNLRGFQGSVSDGYVTHLRFSDSGWEGDNSGYFAYAASFIPHEVFHFWNGGLVNSNGAASWLHEGSAEYAAHLVSIGDTQATRLAFNAELSENLNRCRYGLSRLNDPALDGLAFLPNPVRYPCGMIMMWAADMRVQRDSAGVRSFYELWADIVSRGLSRTDRAYSVADFDELASGNGGRPIESVRILRVESGPSRFAKFVDALRTEGAKITESATEDTRRTAVIFHILKQDCRQVPGTSMGYGITDNVVTLDSHDQCGPLSGSPILTHVDGVSIDAISESDFAALQTKCAAKSELAFKLGDGRTVAIICKSALAAAQTNYVIESWGTK